MSKQRIEDKTYSNPTNERTNNNSSVEPPSGENSGMWGWVENTGDWIAGKYNDVTQGVSDWAGGVRDSANEIWDVVESSEFSAKDGIWSLQTDLDEIQDVAGLEGISLDREASDNEVTMEVNRNTGVLTLKCANLAVNALSFEGLTVQSVALSDVHIEVENASVNAGFLGTLSAKKGGKTNAPQNVTLRAASIVGHGVKVEDSSINGGQPISVDALRLESFTLKANGSKELFEDAPNQASFSVANAVLQGVKTQQRGQAVSGDISMAGTSGSFDSNQGTASVGIDDIRASQLVAGQNTVENSHFKGVQANIASSGTGHSASISANHADVSGIDTTSVDAGNLSGSSLSASFDTSTQAVTATAGAVEANNLTGMGGSVSSVNAANLQVSSDLDDQQHNASVGSLSASDLQHTDTSAGQVSVTDLTASSSSAGQSGTIGSADISQLSAYGHTADNLSVGGAAVSNVGNASSLRLDTGSVNGYSSQLGSAQNASISNVDLRHGNEGSSATIGNVSANNVESMGASAENITVSGTSMGQSSSGSNVAVSQASVSGLSGNGANVGSLTVTDASAHGNANMTQSGFNVGQLSGKDFSHADGSIGDMTLSSIAGNRIDNNYQASIGTVSANNANLTGVIGAQSISGSNASVQATVGNQTTYSANLEELSASGIKDDTFGARADSATFKGANVSGVDTNEVHAQLDSGQVNNFAMQGGTVETAAIKNGSASMVGDHGDVRLDEVNFNNAQYGEMLSIDSGVANNLRTHGTAASQQGSLGSANINNVTITQPQSVTQVGQASLTDGQFTHSGNGKGSMGVSQMGAKEIQVDISDMDKGASVSGSTSAPVADVDFNELISSGASRLDTANIQAQVGLNEGRIGSGFTSVGIDQGTHLDANINVANNQIQDGSSIVANKALDTLAFTSVKGGYVKDGELMADVRGWFDMGVSQGINKEMGLEGKNLHSIGDYATAISNLPENDSPSTDNPIDLSTLRATGNASLSDGTVSAGDASLTLAGASEGKNQMSFEATNQHIAMKFAQLLASSFQLNTAIGSGQTGDVAVDNGSFTVNPQKGTARGLIDGVSVSDVQIQN